MSMSRSESNIIEELRSRIQMLEDRVNSLLIRVSQLDADARMAKAKKAA